MLYVAQPFLRTGAGTHGIGVRKIRSLADEPV
jgi:hypothetical protein